MGCCAVFEQELFKSVLPVPCLQRTFDVPASFVYRFLLVLPDLNCFNYGISVAKA